MDFRFVFLDPQGRLAPKPFAQGLILLTGAMMIITIVTAIGAAAFGPLQYLLVFPYICVFGKRLHDAGLSAWLWLAFVAAYIFFSAVLTAFLMPLLSPAAFLIQAEIQKVMETSGLTAAFETMSERAPEIARLSIVTTVAAFLLASGLVGFAAYRMRSDKTTNRHGPPTDDSARAAGTFS